MTVHSSHLAPCPSAPLPWALSKLSPAKCFSLWDFPVAQTVKNLPAMLETPVQSLGWEDFPGKGNGNPLQYSCLENFTDGGAWCLQSTGSEGVGHDSNNTFLSFFPWLQAFPLSFLKLRLLFSDNKMRKQGLHWWSSG